MVIFICQLGLRIGCILAFHLTTSILYLIHFVLATKAADYFQAFSQDLVRICCLNGAFFVKLKWTIS